MIIYSSSDRCRIDGSERQNAPSSTFEGVATRALFRGKNGCDDSTNTKKKYCISTSIYGLARNTNTGYAPHSPDTWQSNVCLNFLFLNALCFIIIDEHVWQYS